MKPLVEMNDEAHKTIQDIKDTERLYVKDMAFYHLVGMAILDSNKFAEYKGEENSGRMYLALTESGQEYYENHKDLVDRVFE